MTPATNEPVDSWVAEGIAYGLGGVRRRMTADHEALHAAAALAYGWTVTSASLDGVDRGRVTYQPPSGRPSNQLQREQLAITMAPAILGDRQSRSGPDAVETMELAAKIAGNGIACIATSRATDKVFNEAARELRRLAGKRSFSLNRIVVREQLEEHGHVDQDAFAHLANRMTPKSRAASKPKAKPQTLKATKAHKSKASNGCQGCSRPYTPHHATGRCFECRGAR